MPRMCSKSSIESNEGVSDTSLEYEVFLSFRGPDTRDKFTDHLYVRLKDAGIRVYRDDEELRIGEQIGAELLKAINQSKIAMPIFSKGYAASKWCLKELTQIAECKRTTGMKVLPIFYDVTPSEVRNQTGNYNEAFQSHEESYDEEIIANWKRALREIGELKGWDISGAPRPEGELVKEITNATSHELKKANLKITNGLVGLEHHVDEVLKTLNAETNDVKIIVIHGMGGIGKTTLGKVIYNHLLPRFESHCFLADIRETVQSKGMEFLQERLISNILNVKSMDFSNVDERTRFINERVCNKRVLLLMDDVDEIFHLEALIERRDQFGYGSRIIITTRNKGIFDQFEVDRSYELSGLDFHHALQLFSKHAFQNEKPPEEYVVLSQRIVEIAGGLPLALEVYGSLLCRKSMDEWVSTVESLEKFPRKEVIAKLRISFDALDEPQKCMFLDIACFFIGKSKNIVIHFWDELESPEEVIEVLQQMSLIKIKEDHSLWMHDQLRDLGRELVRLEDKEPERRSRLWNEEEATKVLMQKKRKDDVRGINLNFEWKADHSVSNEDFARLPNLRFLHVNRFFPDKWHKRVNLRNFFRESLPIFSKLRWLSWHGFPHEYDTSHFSVENLVMLDLSYSNIKSSWGGWSRIKMAKNLKVLNLTGCKKLVRTPNFSSHLKLERLILRECSKLVEIDESISMLEHLVIIDLKGCYRLRKLPKVLSCTKSLEEFIIDDTNIAEIPNWAPMRRLRVFSCSQYIAPKMLLADKAEEFAENFFQLKFTETLLESSKDSTSWIEQDLSWTKLIWLPDTIGRLKYLKVLKGRGQVTPIETFPESIRGLASLIELDLSYTKIMELPDTIGDLKNLKVLRVYFTLIRKLPAAIGMLENLRTLDASPCPHLHNIPKLPQSLISLKLQCKDIQDAELSNLINLKNLDIATSWIEEYAFKTEDPTPWWIGGLINLESLTLSIRQIISLPADLGKLSQLTELKLFDCKNLESIPMLPPGLKDLSIFCCDSLGSLLDLPSGLASLSIFQCSLTLLDLSHLGKLRYLRVGLSSKSKLKGIHDCDSLQKLHIWGCGSLSEIDGLEMFENLHTLDIRLCENLQRLPDLSNLKRLRSLYVWDCPNLVEISGTLESLHTFSIMDCKSLERIPDIPNSKTMGSDFSIKNCGKIKRSSV